MKTAEDRHS